ncbi:glycosyl hydrolase family 65 [Siphonobacter sp. SORGH_AS_0500]|uniref:glycosyl hydrolase family 95 catalytic domain-containing protein n=1 Tax=Siphonobacter sp. SORGH_AS_0500 TaxID=1864824 RepID=UPI000CB9D448|nr:glycoside hydrolase family 65 protein [Siphonobacter sp. SORGH_AS_0500]PKK38070.1 glycosyl hydrolase family 65 [Siphonobacter sp. SORGH_AS_0500]
MNITKSLLLFCSALSSSWLQAQDLGWTITAQDINPNRYYGVSVANGMIGIVSSATPLKVNDVVLNGTFDSYGRGRVSNILKVFDFANMDLEVDGQRVDRTGIQHYQQELDMKHATLTTSFTFGNKVVVKESIRALRHLPHTALIDVEIQAKADVEITPHSVLSSPDLLRDVENFYHTIDRPHSLIPLMTSVAKSPTGKHLVAASNSFIFNEPRGKEPALIHEEWDSGLHRLKFSKKLKAGETYRFSIVGSVISTEHTPDPHNEAERLTIFAALERRDRLVQRHNEAWDKLWESDIIIEGDPEAQRAARFSLYHLYSFCREGQAYSLSPMGLSGLGYNGHVFWDTEIWMYPPVLLMHPEIAKSLLEYRFERMDAARQNAKSHGYQGVMFPWESDDKGQEATPVWALTGPFQHHITGDVGFAFWKYYQVTQDKIWLKDRGYPLLKEVADFWVSRAEKGKDGKYHIINVVCADEWAENVDDNAYTNGMAREVLSFANQAARELGFPENSRWKEVAEGLVIYKFPDGVTKEYATYNGEIIKQGDVNLLAYPMKQVTDPKDIKKDLDYYWKVLADNQPGRKGQSPAMAHGIFSILYNRLGETDKAYELYMDSYKPNEVPPFGVLAETAGGTNPYFATGAGGYLQTLLAGFGGLDITDKGIIQLKTRLPKHWKSLTLKGIGVDKKTYVVK